MHNSSHPNHITRTIGIKDSPLKKTVDSAICSGRIVLEQLGLPCDQARKLSKFYKTRERHHLMMSATRRNKNVD